jgi:hypothetical protein
MGQVLESGETGRGVDTILVQAVKDSKPIASATTNNYGEFRLLLPDAAGVELWIGVSSQNCFLLKVPALDQIPESGQM